MKNELQKHKKSDKVKWIVVFTAVILLAVTVTAMITKGFKDFNPFGWFNKKVEQNSDTATANLNTGFIKNSLLASEPPFVDSLPIPTVTTTIEPHVDGAYVVMETCTDSFRATVLDSQIQIFEFTGQFKIQLFSSEVVDGQSEYFGEVTVPSEYVNGLVARVPFHVLYPDVPNGIYAFGDRACYLSTTTSDGYNLTGRQPHLRTDALPLPADPIKEGYTFIGWYSDKDLTVPYTGQFIYSDTEIYAKFEIIKFTVYLNANCDASFDFTPVFEINYGDSVTLPNISRVDYDLVGWFLPDGTQYTNQPIKAQTTLNARWKIKTFTVTFYVDGEIYKTFTVEYGQSFYKVIEQENLALNVKSIVANDGSPIDTAINDLTVTTDMSAEADLKSTAQRAVTSWWKLLIGAALGIALVAFLCCIPSMVKGKKHRRKG